MHLQIGLVRADFNQTKTAVEFELRRLITNHIFTAQSLLDLCEGVPQLCVLLSWQDAPTARARQQIQHRFAFGVVIRTDDVGAQREQFI